MLLMNTMLNDAALFLFARAICTGFNASYIVKIYFLFAHIYIYSFQ